MKNLHSAFRIPHSALTMLFAVLLYSSCTDVAEPMSPNNHGQPLEELREQARQEAMAAWEKFQAENNLEYRDGSSGSGGGSTTRDPIPCECTYVIEEVNYTLPDGQSEFNIDFFSIQSCAISGCNLLEGNYSSNGSCIVPLPCGPTWSNLPPTGHQPFSCLVPANTTFPAYASASWHSPTCGGGSMNWTIKFKIYCQQVQQDSNCSFGQGYGFVSDLITLTNQSQNVIIQLQDCGCNPVVIE